MWEAILGILISPNALLVLIFLLIFVLILITLIATGNLKINTKAVYIGNKSEKERIIVSQQISQAYLYIMSLENKLITMVPGYDVDHDYRIKFTLEKAFNQVVQWITFNHIEDSIPYIHVKQREMLSVIYALHPTSPFKTPEFNERVMRWVEELIRMLLDIRNVYSKNRK